ncbi:MAG: YHS domain-containing protein [Desulfohalobiaceae bacterium]
MFKVIVFLVAGFLLYKLVMGDQKKKMEAKGKKTSKKVEAGEMVKDPVCGTYVSVDSDIRVKQGGQVYYFCSYECRDRFLQENR